MMSETATALTAAEVLAGAGEITLRYNNRQSELPPIAKQLLALCTSMEPFEVDGRTAYVTGAGQSVRALDWVDLTFTVRFTSP